MRWIERETARLALTGSLALAACAGAGCGTARDQGASDRSAASAVTSSVPVPGANSAGAAVGAAADAGADAESDGGGDAESPVAEVPVKKRTGELAHFFSALDGLEARTRKEHVRVLWLGDSHGQADFWSGKLRKALQSRFGNGGPGFVHIAYRGYRHDGVDLGMTEKWNTTPRGPSTSVPSADGVFGLGGLLTTAKNPGAEASIEITDASLPKKLRWDVCYRFNKPGDAVTVSFTGQKPVTLSPAAGAKIAQKPPLLHTSFTTEWTPPAEATTTTKATADTKAKGNKAVPKGNGSKNKGPRMTISPSAGYPSFCGAVIETDPVESPGVVLDMLGINGARYTTVLAWDEEAWLTEYLRRAPQLVIFEYGTNEAGDVGVKVESYADKVAKVVQLIRKKKPDTDCVILAPTERADQEERSGRVRDVLREAAKANVCWFWDTIEAMGGKGSMRSWRDDNPPKGAKDGIHLTVKGYFELGEKLGQDLLKKY